MKTRWHSVAWFFTLLLAVAAERLDAQPYASTLQATAVTQTNALLNGFATPNGQATAAWFEWGTNRNYGYETATVDVGSGSNVVFVRQQIDGLSAGVVYHFRLVSSNAMGVAYGTDRRLSCGQTYWEWEDECYDFSGPTSVSNVVQMANGGGNRLVLLGDGSVRYFGSNPYGANVSPTPGDALRQPPLVAVANSGTHCVGITRDSTVVAWGWNGPSNDVPWGKTNVPPGLSNVVAICAGDYNSFALKSDGTVVCFGLWFHVDGLIGTYDRVSGPIAGLSNIVAISSEFQHFLALRNDGTVFVAGYDSAGETHLPAGLTNVIDICASMMDTYVITSDGQVHTCGFSDPAVPGNRAAIGWPMLLNDVVQIDARSGFVVALTGDGLVHSDKCMPVNIMNASSVSCAAATYSALGDVAPIPPPQIIEQPTNTVAGVGWITTFSVRASDWSSVTAQYQWKQNGQTLTDGGRYSGCTTPRLTIANVQYSDEAIYTVEITNNSGFATSDPAALTVTDGTGSPNGPPYIIQQPADRTVMVGSRPFLSMEAIGKQPMDVQWWHIVNGVLWDMPVLSELSGRMDPIKMSDAGTYVVRLLNSVGTTTSHQFTLTVLTKDHDPAILQQPQSQTVAAGSTVTFEPDIWSAGILTYIWSKDGVESFRVEGGPYPDEFGGKLILQNVTAADSGTYSVRAYKNSDPAATVTSTEAVLQVADPLITVRPGNAFNVQQGSNVTLFVSAVGTPPLSYQWRVDGVDIFGATDSSYTFFAQPINGKTNLTYAVVVSNPIGSASSDGTLTSHTASLKTTQAASISRNPHGKVTIAADVAAPTVSFSRPAANSQITTGFIQGNVTDNKRVARVMSWVTNSVDDGSTKYEATLHGTSLKAKTWDVTVPLQPGTNAVFASATDFAGNVSKTAVRRFFNAVTSRFTLASNGTGTGIIRSVAGRPGTTLPTDGAMLNIGEGYVLTAVPNASSVFTQWTGNFGPGGASATTTNRLLKFVMTPGLSIQATFTAKPVR